MTNTNISQLTDGMSHKDMMALNKSLQDKIKKNSKTTALIEEWKGTEYFKIFKTDQAGNKLSDFPVRGTSVNKSTAALLVKHIDELRVFATK